MSIAPIAVALLALTACTATPDRPFCEPGRACSVASAESCATGLEATRHGRPTFANGTCVATDDATCAASSLTCALWGQCHARPAAGTSSSPLTSPSSTVAGQPGSARPSGDCSASDDRDSAASRDPACTTDTCVALGDDCKSAGVCRLEGRCTAGDGVCIATDLTACKSSDNCKLIGWCSLQENRCRPTTVADCIGAETCTDNGKCALSAGRCVPCSRAPECKSEGLCARVGARCAATENRHCNASSACQREGRCKAARGTCVK